MTKFWLIDLVSWTTLGSLFGGDESDESGGPPEISKVSRLHPITLLS